MLTYINIKNFVLIRELELDLQPEMTVLTGETGAGKSIIIDSLELALGGRSDATQIFGNEEKAEITAIFDLTNLENAQNFLIEQELDSENECIIRRVIFRDGKSKSSINGNPCTQQTLRMLREFLLDIHGQHEHQLLLNTERQREMLDSFASSNTLAREVSKHYNSWLKCKKNLIELETLVQDHKQKIDFLNYELKELADLNLAPEYLADLHREQKRINNAEEIASNLNMALSIITEDEEASVVRGLYRAKSTLEKCKNLDTKTAVTIELLQNAIIQADEAAANLRQNLATIEIDSARQKEIEDQLTLLHNLARKHQVPPENLEQVRMNLEQKLKDLLAATTRIEELTKQVKNAEDIYLKAAKELSTMRRLAATQLNQLITAKMKILGLAGSKFEVHFSQDPQQNFSASGLERVEFFVSTNAGQDLQPLKKVASGGELSRISLAIQVITSEKEVTPTLIFDEIDSGIGGKTADMVGQLLRKLSAKAQVLCVTHLPQVAVQGHHHLFVEKAAGTKNTEIRLATLDKNKRTNEIARMLGGMKITKQTLIHAEEMLNMAV